MTKDEALERKAENARELGLNYEPEQKVDWEKLYWLEVKKKEAIAAKYERDIKPLTKIVPMAQPEQEPVTWRYKIVDVFGRPAWTLKTPKSDTRVLESQPLYTTPPQRPSRSDIKPLTDEELFKLWVRVPAETEDRFAFARAIEAAHGIGCETTLVKGQA